MTQDMLIDSSLLNTQYYKVGIKGKVELFREENSTLSLHRSVEAFEKGSFHLHPLRVAKFTYIYALQ